MQLPIVQMQHGGVHVRGKAVVAPPGEEHDVGQLHVQDLQPTGLLKLIEGHAGCEVQHAVGLCSVVGVSCGMQTLITPDNSSKKLVIKVQSIID